MVIAAPYRTPPKRSRRGLPFVGAPLQGESFEVCKKKEIRSIVFA